MPNKHKVTNNGNGFHVDKSDQEKSVEAIKNNGNPQNKDLMNLLLIINDKLDALSKGE